MLEIDGIDHVALRVADVQRMLRFYVDVLGCKMKCAQPDLGIYQLWAGSGLIVLRDVTAGPGPTELTRLDHVCLRLKHFDVAEIRRHLTANGVNCGDPVTRDGVYGEGPVLYIRDPEGNVLELKAPPDRS